MTSTTISALSALLVHLLLICSTWDIFAQSLDKYFASINHNQALIFRVMLNASWPNSGQLLGQHQNPTLWITCRLYKGTQWVSKMWSKFDGNRIIIEHWLIKAFPHTTDGGNPKRTQLRCLLVMYSVYILCYNYCTLFEYC